MSEDNTRQGPGTDYTNVTFEEIKKSLIERAKSHYPDTYRDFSKSSFGSLMFDLVAMVGEQLNFYAQFVANEGFVDFARSSIGLNGLASERDILLSDSNSTCLVVLNCSVEASSEDNLGPDRNSIVEVAEGTTVTGLGGQVAQLLNTTTFNPAVDEPVSTSFSEDGSRGLIYNYEKFATAVIGEIRTFVVDIQNPEHFSRIRIPDISCTEIIDCFDREGRRYLEVPNLLVDTVLMPIRYRSADDETILTKDVNYPAPRRFMVEEDPTGQKYLLFGYGSEDVDKSTQHPVEPINQSSRRRARNSTTDRVILPEKYFGSGKYGIPPRNTTLTIRYRVNTVGNSNLPVGAIDRFLEPIVTFAKDELLTPSRKEFIINNLSCTNREPANGLVRFRSTKEIAMHIKASSGAQGRAVTPKDLIAMCYNMPPRLGRIKKASVLRDVDGLRKNLNVYVIAEDSDQNLEKANSVLKENLRTHLNSVKMMTDSIDIFDAEVLNIGIRLDIVLHEKENKNSAMSRIREFLFNEFTQVVPEIGQPFSIGEIERILNLMPIIKRVNRIQVRVKNGAGYSSTTYDVAPNTTEDGLVLMPENFIWELKNPTDIIGIIK